MDFVRLDFLNDADDAGDVTQVAVPQRDLAVDFRHIELVLIALVEAVGAGGHELEPLAQQELS